MPKKTQRKRQRSSLLDCAVELDSPTASPYCTVYVIRINYHRRE
jgi:hypothetical protein